MTGEELVGEARRWIGTPYRHGAALRGVGCDCLGLVLGVAAACGRPYERSRVPAGWAEAGQAELLLDGLGAALHPRWRREPGSPPAPALRAGDVAVLRWRAGRPASHVALATGAGGIIHAHAGACVAEVAWTAALARRLAALFILAEDS